MEFLKNYYFTLEYLPRKENVGVDALIQKSILTSSLMVKELELLEKF